METKPNHSSPAPAPTDGPGRILLAIVSLASALAVVILLFALVRGFQNGQRQSEAQRRQQIGIHLQSAKDYLADGKRREALAEYQKVLVLDAENQAAIDGIGSLLDDPNPAGQTPAPVAVPIGPTATPTSLNPLEAIWADAQALYQAGRWDEAIDRLLQVKATNPDFHADEVEEMLYTAYVSLGTEKSNAGSLEEAVNLFDKALALRPDAVEIRTVRDVTAQYVDALTYWYADWPRVIELLDQLYRRNPGYRDVQQRLQKAHLEYADSLARQGEWCTAAAQYQEARAVQEGPGLAEKQTEFQTLCDRSPAEAAAGEGTPTSAEADATPEASTLPGGLGTGRILYSSQDPVDGRYHIYAQPVTVSVRPVVLVEDAMQPALRDDGQRLAFRSMRGDIRGLGSYDPATGLRLRFTTFSEDSLPSWNPEGNRLVFASNREGDRRWRIYTAWADGNDNGSSLVFGQDPQWHPSADRIVYRGCDERGNGCGLWTMRSNGADPAPLTSVPGDARPVWSPDGRYVVFMSEERDGNWEIYRIDVSSGAIIRMTKDPGIDGLPTVSPDGSRIAFLSNRDGNWQIWIKPITGGAEQPLAPIQGDLPNWLEHDIQWVK